MLFIEHSIKITYYWCSNVQNAIIEKTETIIDVGVESDAKSSASDLDEEESWAPETNSMVTNGWIFAEWIVQSYKHTYILIWSGF
jgi:hypothetical protein